MRFATRKPAAARKFDFSATYGTTKEAAEKVILESSYGVQGLKPNTF
jgi:hypothetical protein